MASSSSSLAVELEAARAVAPAAAATEASPERAPSAAPCERESVLRPSLRPEVPMTPSMSPRALSWVSTSTSSGLATMEAYVVAARVRDASSVRRAWKAAAEAVMSFDRSLPFSPLVPSPAANRRRLPAAALPLPLLALPPELPLPLPLALPLASPPIVVVSSTVLVVRSTFTRESRRVRTVFTAPLASPSSREESSPADMSCASSVRSPSGSVTEILNSGGGRC
mmetsp:Transcript_24691/g.78062  ORF Transcript_24691/g.78062 Transcript_24691/m.78062 type:complete len:225 (-) Transcript_24691:2823-3497(-)